MYWQRFDDRHGLYTGGNLLLQFRQAERMRAYVAERMELLFPQIVPVTIDPIWNGYVGMTRDFFPRMHQLGPAGFAWAGCNGRAVGLSIALGRELARSEEHTSELQSQSNLVCRLLLEKKKKKKNKI